MVAHDLVTRQLVHTEKRSTQLITETPVYLSHIILMTNSRNGNYLQTW